MSCGLRRLVQNKKTPPPGCDTGRRLRCGFMHTTHKPTIVNTATACNFAGHLIDLSLHAEREYLSAAMIAPDAALRAAVEVDLTGADWVADHHSALFFWLCRCGERGMRWNAAAFVQTARAAGIDVDAEDVDDIEFRHDAFPRELPMHAAAVKSYAQQRRDAQGHFRALDAMAARLDDRHSIDRTCDNPPRRLNVPPRLRRKVGSR